MFVPKRWIMITTSLALSFSLEVWSAVEVRQKAFEPASGLHNKQSNFGKHEVAGNQGDRAMDTVGADNEMVRQCYPPAPHRRMQDTEYEQDARLEQNAKLEQNNRLEQDKINSSDQQRLAFRLTIWAENYFDGFFITASGSKDK